jgi:hypothetical protein
VRRFRDALNISVVERNAPVCGYLNGPFSCCCVARMIGEIHLVSNFTLTKTITPTPTTINHWVHLSQDTISTEIRASVNRWKELPARPAGGQIGRD